MRKPKVSTNFGKYSDAGLETIAAHIVDCMTENPLFLLPVPAIPAVAAALAKYSNHLLAAKKLGLQNVAEKNKSRKELEALLSQLALWVMAIANGDRPGLVSSGFPLQKDHEPVYITSPGNVTLVHGVSSGEMIAGILKGIKGAKSFVFSITTEFPGEHTIWTNITSSSIKHVFKNLVPGKQYWVKVTVVGSRNQEATSPVNSMFVS